MIEKRLTALMAGTVLLALTAGTASAYLPEGKTFRERAGSVASLTVADVASDPAAIALKAAIAIAPAKETFLEKRDRAAMTEFYSERDYKPVWVNDGRLTPAAQAVMARIALAAEDGLDPAAYSLPAKTLGSTAPLGPDLAAAVEITLDRALLTYARQAYAGRLDPAAVGKLITIKPLLPDPVAILASVSSAPDAAAAVDGYNPPHAGYRALKAALAEARQQTPADAPAPIAEGKLLKLGVSDARVPLLRARLGLAPVTDNPDLYDNALAEAVARFQASSGLKADGAAGGNTIAFLNGVGKNNTAEIIANMERWRWMPRDLGAFHVAVNVPEFEVRVVDDGKVVHQTRVVTGKITNQTPIFSDEMESIVVNPSWNVPASITMKEMLPNVRRDPSYLSRNGYQVLARVGGKVVPVSPSSIDWSTASARNIQIRQVPGDDNALGSIKFLFPNEHAVYLHDTPSKSLFQRDSRAFSHGCVRVQNPLDFADVLLTYEGGWTKQRLRKMIGGRESWVKLPKKIPIHITYFTAFVDDAGKLQTRPDIYGYDARVERALGL
ncbi:L,D-transpeptidase family protein [Mesorhizobium sp. BR1-1-16]|uniref:L,D-transpeptidase family protein n=1 Tax=Mesorhizobium sp. BR1-1-16 TaxID=2876653 RepID=UPI001CCCB0F2|nr:L,D-transpeptidase family protein [Mesorhizobium sp. BR1-1-16]MBZ9936748.1 L,D-transpeptidase family protein [Mesorhizobium sp. BR1-1-16]